MTTNFYGWRGFIVPLESPDYGQNMTDREIEQSVQPGYSPEQFDLDREDQINPDLFDDMNRRRDDASREAHQLAVDQYESPAAVMPQGFEMFPGAEHAGIASMTRSIINRRAVALGLANASPVMPFMAETEARSAQPHNVHQFSVPSEPVIRRSTEDPTQERYGLAA